MEHKRGKKRIGTQLTKSLLLLLLLTVGASAARGQGEIEYFEYEDTYEKTIINGLTFYGNAASSLTIPATVTTVRSGAFSSAASLSTLIIEAGGNPAFETGLFVKNDTPKDNPIAEIRILGSSMTVANIRSLLVSLVAQGALSTVYIEGYSGEWSDIEVTDVLTSTVSVVLPATLVTTQQFGNAKVYGRFYINKEIISYCTSATFYDADDGSNQLFYVADYRAGDGRLHIRRVRYVKAGAGVLIHRIGSSTGDADLLRVSDGSISEADKTLYSSNLLVGVTEATDITATISATASTYSYFILKDGAFHPTNGGTVKANKAYLRIPTAAARDGALAIEFDDEEMTNILTTTNSVDSPNSGAWYSLDGRKLDTMPTTKGIYINNGKKYVIR